jgi:hypothetical protein
LSGGALCLFWKIKVTRVACVTAFTLIGVLLVMPGREYSRSALCQRYVECLKQYEGAPYVWGGESARGIDCSGLVRRGLIDANFQNGMTTELPPVGIPIRALDSAADNIFASRRLAAGNRDWNAAFGYCS